MLKDSERFCEEIQDRQPTIELFLHVTAVTSYSSEGVEGTCLKVVSLRDDWLQTGSVADSASTSRFSRTESLYRKSIATATGTSVSIDEVLCELCGDEDERDEWASRRASVSSMEEMEEEPSMGLERLPDQTTVEEESLQVRLPLIHPGPRTFFFDTAVRSDNTVGTTGDALQQFKRRTRLIVERPFPWLKHYQRIQRVEEYLLSPLENAIGENNCCPFPFSGRSYNCMSFPSFSPFFKTF